MFTQSPRGEKHAVFDFTGHVSRIGALIFRIKGDIGSEEDCISVARQVQAKFGSIVHVLVNNAAAFIFHSVETATAADWDHSAAINIKGHALLTKHLLPFMKVLLH